MHHFRSLLIGRAQVQIPGLRILTFALHRHLQEHASIEPHRHRWSQAILYLSGQGRQVFANGAAQVQPGTLVVVPPGVLHAFHRTTERPPLCLMIDFRLHGARRHKCVVCTVNRSELTQVRQHLTHLLKLQSGASRMLRWESAMVILQLLITMLRASGWAERLHVAAGGATTPAIQRLLSQLDPTIPLMDLVQRSGYQRDHLNRLVKKETGLTLGQLRTRHRLAKAKALLAQGMQVANVGAAVGLPDRSYFARWFRRQTGQPPSRWSHRGLG
jgi:AraC family L-rhamnose operon transcriptional activator RhaR